jgi:3-oxoacyl-[acyl-carrier protein] reductase
MAKQRTVLITGAGAGIGREMACRFSRSGDRIVALDCDAEGNAATAALIKTDGGSCDAITADVGSADDVRRAFQEAGPVDVLVNNAAFSRGDGLILDVDDVVWDRVLQVCLKGVFLCSREALKSMVERRAGAIVNISSVNATIGIHLAAYSAAKGGILSFTRVAAAQYARYGIRVNAVCPGTILSDSSEKYYREHPDISAELRAMYPGGRFGTVGDVAACVEFLASGEAGFINGAVFAVDGGLTGVHRIPSLTPFIEE